MLTKQYKNVKTNFSCLTFFTNKFVYKTKYETEYVVFMFENLYKKINNINTVYEICCGNGCVGISIKKKYNNLKLILVDNNIYAAHCVVKNIILHNVNIDFFYKNIFDFDLIECDIVICNPPYISSDCLTKNMYKTLYNSINGGKNGYEFVLKLFLILTNVKYVILELGSVKQYKFINKKLNNKCNNWECVDFLKPYNNLEICFCVFKNLRL